MPASAASSASASQPHPAAVDASPSAPAQPGEVLRSSALRARVVDNGWRPSALDLEACRASGLASLVHAEQRKTLFSTCGLNLQAITLHPTRGEPRRAGVREAVPLALERADAGCARIRLRAEDHIGMDVAMDYRLEGDRIDHAIAVTAREDLAEADLFFASYMNQVQNTSIYLQGMLTGDREPRWYEAASAGHLGPDHARVYYRPFDPAGRRWHEHLVDNPLLRQSVIADHASIAATLAAGFRTSTPNKCAFTGFYYGLIDEYAFTMLFREPQFYFWISASGGTTLRNPAWDYGIRTGPMAAGEARVYHARLSFRRFTAAADIVREAAEFRGTLAPLCGGFAW